ncbi:hypothetical protein D3C85_774770 [compost metagenome]
MFVDNIARVHVCIGLSPAFVNDRSRPVAARCNDRFVDQADCRRPYVDCARIMSIPFRAAALSF